jgi:hypothetical protein
MTADVCPDCGAKVDSGREGCQALWNEWFYGIGLTHPAAFDAYCMQHLEKYCASAKSYAAHLTRLACCLAYEAAPSVYSAIQKWLNGHREVSKPAILPFLGGVTIADVYAAETAVARDKVTRAWVESVWAAYAPQHESAHAWIKEALAAT